MPAFALFEIDTSVDDEIRKKYDTDKIERDYGLPPLPENLKQEINDKSKTNSNNTNNTKPIIKTEELPKKQYATVTEKKKISQPINLKSGMKFNVRSISVITDKLHIGARVYFKLSEPIKTKYYSLPENTKFSGVVVNSHTPQITGNGGLVEIVIDDIIVEGNWKTINAKITLKAKRGVFIPTFFPIIVAIVVTTAECELISPPAPVILCQFHSLFVCLYSKTFKICNVSHTQNGTIKYL